MPVPLPPNDYQNQRWREAYDKCLRHEQNAPGDNDSLSLVRARILGYSMREAPDDDLRDCLAREINSCNDDNEFRQLETLYIHRFHRYLRAAEARCTRRPSTPPIGDTQEFLKSLLDEAPQTHETAHSKALLRDGYRCVLTGAYDFFSTTAMPYILPPGAIKGAYTKATHILPEWAGTDEDGQKLDDASSVWAVMSRNGNSLVFDELNGAAVHRLENVMTLSLNDHAFFECLYLWLESMDAPHTYRLNSVHPSIILGIPPTVTFMTPDPANLPRPSPVYLKFHAAAARVAHLSGAGKYIRKILTDVELMSELSGEGAAADLLATLLGGVPVD